MTHRETGEVMVLKEMLNYNENTSSGFLNEVSLSQISKQYFLLECSLRYQPKDNDKYLKKNWRKLLLWEWAVHKCISHLLQVHSIYIRSYNHLIWGSHSRKFQFPFLYFFWKIFIILIVVIIMAVYVQQDSSKNYI